LDLAKLWTKGDLIKFWKVNTQQ